MDNQCDDDPVDKTGCREWSDRVVLCHDKHKDWRACQEEIKAFKRCYADYLAALSNTTTTTDQSQSSSKHALTGVHQ